MRYVFKKVITYKNKIKTHLIDYFCNFNELKLKDIPNCYYE